MQTARHFNASTLARLHEENEILREKVAVLAHELDELRRPVFGTVCHEWHGSDVLHITEVSRNCIGDGGRSPAAALQGEAANHHIAAWL